jgi:hypothetical protein
MAEALLEREVLDGAEGKALIEGGHLAASNTPKNTDDPKGQPVMRPDDGIHVPGLDHGGSPQPA